MVHGLLLKIDSLAHLKSQQKVVQGQCFHRTGLRSQVLLPGAPSEVAQGHGRREVGAHVQDVPGDDVIDREIQPLRPD